MTRGSLLFSAFLHEIFPSGPWVLVAVIGVGIVFVTPLYVLRRMYGGKVLVLATALEVIAGAALAGTEGVMVPAAFGGAAVALILHARAVRRPDGYKVVDIGLAIAGFWLTLLAFAIVSSFVVG
jgi:hypothetical protein